VNEGGTVNSQEVERLTAQQLDKLHRELADTVTPDDIARVGKEHYDTLCQRAAVTDFIPLLVYRFTKDDLARHRNDQLDHAA
jgi:hypothetical protein